MTITTTATQNAGGLLPAGTAAASTGTATASTGPTASSPQDLSKTFLSLLVAQLNNQDPLNPVDNSQITSQMAQISTVTGINNMNSSISQLMSQFQQSEAIQAAQLNGHSVMVAGSGIALASGSGAGAVGAFDVATAADTVTVQIKDANGAVVRSMQLGAESTGLHDFAWDGMTDAGAQAAAGSYTFSVTASAGGNAVTSNTYGAQQVVGVAPQADGTTQLVLGNGSQVAYSSVKQIL
ncbi:MAG TPA: flagellar hook assembly protein FlgD [Burkholderiaceae bacterium]